MIVSLLRQPEVAWSSPALQLALHARVRLSPRSRSSIEVVAGVAENVCGQDRRQFALLTATGTAPVFWI